MERTDCEGKRRTCAGSPHLSKISLFLPSADFAFLYLSAHPFQSMPFHFLPPSTLPSPPPPPPPAPAPPTPSPSLLPYLPLLFHSSSLSLSALPPLIHHPKPQVSLILLQNMPSFIKKWNTHTHTHVHLARQLQVCARVPGEPCCNLTLLFSCRLECLGLGLPHHTKPVPQPGQRNKHQQI